MVRTAQGERDRLARLIDNTFFAHYDGGRPAQACLYWAHYTVEVLTALGVSAIIQAGSASWPRLRPDQDDGTSPTHHSYVWEPDSEVTKARLAAGDLPEIHVWAAIPERGELIDMTTRYWPEQCRLIQGLDWPGEKPPTYFWGTADEVPERVLYKPDMKAIALALHLSKGDVS
ncbi:MAG: hypothetical protein L0Y72_24350 [Gemmataceae bacterium]|nr:hypothetical protein [Gemmataceae bacterium]MCI0742177.1 hypothetical protein [Gemmataceae bacterium]